MEISPQDIPWQSLYKLMIGAIVPRPIGWVSTVSREGVYNLAPFSFFNAVCSNPPTLLFCPTIRVTDHAQKDTTTNVRETGEFVVNIVSEALAEAMNTSATEFPAGVDEFGMAGVTPAPSLTVSAPRVLESPINFECRLDQIIQIGDGPGGGNIIIGRVLHVRVADEVLFGGDKIDLGALQPVGRLAGNAYCRVTDVFELARPGSQIPRRE